MLLIGGWGKAIAGLCSDACANNFVSMLGPLSVIWGCNCNLNFVSSLQAELVDVQYGTMEDLIRIQAITNVTKKIALLKLGQSPLLYKVSYISAELFIWWGFFAFFFLLKNTKTKCFPFSPISQDLLTFKFFLNTHHCHSEVPFMC